MSALIVVAATMAGSALAAHGLTAARPSSTVTSTSTASAGANPSSSFVGSRTKGTSGEGDGGSESDNPGSFGLSSLFLIVALGATLYFAVRLTMRRRG
jgi:hypothetical protein